MGAVLVILRWLALPSASYASGVFSHEPRFGVIIELLAGVASALCALTLFRRSGEAVPWSKESSS